jgi:hypothetical protein
MGRLVPSCTALSCPVLSSPLLSSPLLSSPLLSSPALFYSVLAWPVLCVLSCSLPFSPALSAVPCCLLVFSCSVVSCRVRVRVVVTYDGPCSWRGRWASTSPFPCRCPCSLSPAHAAPSRATPTSTASRGYTSTHRCGALRCRAVLCTLQAHSYIHMAVCVTDEDDHVQLALQRGVAASCHCDAHARLNAMRLEIEGCRGWHRGHAGVLLQRGAVRAPVARAAT